MKVTVIDADHMRHPAKIDQVGQFVTIDRCPSCRTMAPTATARFDTRPARPPARLSEPPTFLPEEHTR